MLPRAPLQTKVKKTTILKTNRNPSQRVAEAATASAIAATADSSCSCCKGYLLKTYMMVKTVQAAMIPAITKVSWNAGNIGNAHVSRVSLLSAYHSLQAKYGVQQR